MDSGVKKDNRFKRNYSAILSVVFICIGFAFPSVLSGAESLPKEVLRYADMVLFNGKVLTADMKFSIAEAVAVRDGKVMATGSTANMLKMADQNTRRIDLEGKTVVPGLIDTHSHQFQYALSHWREDLTAWEPNLKDFIPRYIRGESVQDVMAKLSSLMTTIKPGRWTQVIVTPRKVGRKMWNKLTIEDIDRVSPNNPLVVRALGNRRFYNSKVGEAVRKRFGYEPRTLVRRGKYHGKSGPRAIRIIMADIMIQNPMKSLAHAYRKEMDAWAAKGITTWSSVISPLVSLNVYSNLDRKGEMPIRLAYTHDTGRTNFPYAIGFYERLGDMAGHGTDYLWNIGVGPGAINCFSSSIKPHLTRKVRCPNKKRRKRFLTQVKAGLRIAGNHVVGDEAADFFMDMIEQGSREAGFSLEQIRDKRHVMDHCGFHPDQAQVERAKRLGIIFSCGPIFLERSARRVKDSGYEYVHSTAPIKRILNAGGKVVIEFDDRDLSLDQGNIFRELLIFVNRKDNEGRIWGADQAVDRKTVLLMSTRWAAEYVLREDVLGSLEPGKWADLLILDRDYLNVPEEDFAKTRVLLTLVGGEIVYTESSFADARGLPKVGFREN